MKQNTMFLLMVLVHLNCALQAQTATEIPFESQEFKTDAHYFRARQSGTSPRVDIAKKMAVLNAKAELARGMEATMKSVTEQYINQTQSGENMQVNSTFQEQIREVASQTLSNSRLAGEKTFFDKAKGLYTVWVVVEVTKESTSDSLLQRIEANPDFQLKIDKKRFEKIFEDEMSKFN